MSAPATPFLDAFLIASGAVLGASAAGAVVFGVVSIAIKVFGS